MSRWKKEVCDGVLTTGDCDSDGHHDSDGDGDGDGGRQPRRWRSIVVDGASRRAQEVQCAVREGKATAPVTNAPRGPYPTTPSARAAARE